MCSCDFQTIFSGTSKEQTNPKYSILELPIVLTSMSSVLKHLSLLVKILKEKYKKTPQNLTPKQKTEHVTGHKFYHCQKILF